MFLFTVFTCDKDESFETQEPIKTVTSNEISTFFNSKGSSLRTSGEAYATPNLDSISQQEITNTNELMTVIDASTIYPDHYSRILLLKINDTIQSTVFSMYKRQDTITTYFTGELLITKLDGSFINGFRVENGELIAQFTKKGKSDSSSARTTNTATCPYHGACTTGSSCIICEQALDEVVINVNTGSSGGRFSVSTIFFDQNENVGYSDYEWQYENGTPGGGSDSNVCTGGKMKDAAGNCNCPDGKAEDANGNCIVSCPIVTGYLHTSAFSGTVDEGDNTITNQDNFRNELGGINVAVNCTGKINTGDVVNVIDARPETRTYVKSDGTIGTSTYYKISYANCTGNNKKNPDYDINKPCSDCNTADPIKSIQILGSVGSGIKGGLYGNDARTYADGTPKAHRGYDIDMPIGTPIYAMFDGEVIQVQENHADLGKWIIIESNVGGKKIQMWYAHMNDIEVMGGQIIDRNFIIGKSGKSGNAGNPGSAGPHLHLAARKIINGKWKKVDPGEFLNSQIDETTGEGTSGC